MPRPDLGVLRFSRGAKTAVDGAIKGAYGLGAADGYSVGQAVGYAGGHAVGTAEGVVIGSVTTAVAFGLIFFCACVLLRLIRR